MLKRLIFIVSLLLCGYLSFAQDFPPKSNTLVTDYTNTLTPDQKQRLENKLVAFSDSTSNQIAIVILKSIGDYDINEYGQQLGRKWGVGEKSKNNGVIIVVALNDHKMTIQTGYGMEGALPDVITQQIRVNDMNPRFKAGDYYGGLDAGTDDIIKYTKGEYKADPKKAREQNDDNNRSGPIGFFIIVIILILIAIFRGRGGGGQVIGSGSSPFWWLLAGSMLGGSGRDSGWGGGGGGSSGGGGGGGFGGFGGGSFGGGGSGGSW